jgi:hypothetical protein
MSNTSHSIATQQPRPSYADVLRRGMDNGGVPPQGSRPGMVQRGFTIGGNRAGQSRERRFSAFIPDVEDPTSMGLEEAVDTLNKEVVDSEVLTASSREGTNTSTRKSTTLLNAGGLFRTTTGSQRLGKKKAITGQIPMAQ